MWKHCTPDRFQMLAINSYIRTFLTVSTHVILAFSGFLNLHAEVSIFYSLRVCGELCRASCCCDRIPFAKC